MFSLDTSTLATTYTLRHNYTDADLDVFLSLDVCVVRTGDGNFF